MCSSDLESLEGAALADCVVLPLPAAGEGSLLNAPLSGRKHQIGRASCRERV